MFQHHSQFFRPPPPSNGLEAWEVFITLPLLLLPLQRESSAPPWSLFQEKQSSMNFLNVSPSHGLQFSWAVPCVGRPWCHRFCQQTCTEWGPLSRGAQVLPGTCSSVGFSHGGHSHPQSSTCSGMESSRVCLSLSALSGLQWTAGLQTAWKSRLWCLEQITRLLLQWSWSQKCFTYHHSALSLKL